MFRLMKFLAITLVVTLTLPAMAQHADVVCMPETCIMTFTPVKQIVHGCGNSGEIGEFAVTLETPEGVTWASF